jgi:putative ABC transport system permease protein
MYYIPLEKLILMLIPIIIVWFFYKKWTGRFSNIFTATLRMTVQLLLIGYVLVYIFATQSLTIGIVIVFFMVAISSWITLGNIKDQSFREYRNIFIAILIGGSFNLALVIGLILNVTPFYAPRFLIPLAGMIYANAMNAVSLSAERFEKEIEKETYLNARAAALTTAIIPQINAFLAVGLVSLPGMMTGQILSGIDPIVTVRYQIMVMAMVFGSAGISVIIYLSLKSRQFSDKV